MRVSANMAESEKDSQRNAEEENILYDLTIHAEWPQEAETIVSKLMMYFVELDFDVATCQIRIKLKYIHNCAS